MLANGARKKNVGKKIKEHKYEISKQLVNELISAEKAKKEQVTDNSVEVTENDQAIIDEAASIPASTWFELSRWQKKHRILLHGKEVLFFSVGTLIGREKKPSIKQSIQALKVYKGAIEKGFTSEN